MDRWNATHKSNDLWKTPRYECQTLWLAGPDSCRRARLGIIDVPWGPVLLCNRPHLAFRPRKPNWRSAVWEKRGHRTRMIRYQCLANQTIANNSLSLDPYAIGICFQFPTTEAFADQYLSKVR